MELRKTQNTKNFFLNNAIHISWKCAKTETQCVTGFEVLILLFYFFETASVSQECNVFNPFFHHITKLCYLSTKIQFVRLSQNFSYTYFKQGKKYRLFNLFFNNLRLHKFNLKITKKSIILQIELNWILLMGNIFYVVLLVANFSYYIYG